jgi:putative transposase
VPRSASGAVAAFVRTIFAQPDHASAMAQLHQVADALHEFPAAAELLTEVAEDVLAHVHFPPEHRRHLHSTNTLERLHKEVKRRSNVVGIFPHRASLIRLVGMVLAEQDDVRVQNDGAPRGCLERRRAHRMRCGFPLERPLGERPSGDVA